MKLTMDKAAALMEQNNGALDLKGTNITALSDNLTVGGFLDLEGTNITALPDNLTVGGGLFLRGTNIKNQSNRHYLHQGDYVEGRYLYADGILTHVKRKKKFQGYTYFEGKIPSRNVVYDGKNYAHCRTFREGIQDLLFKSAKDRGAEQYRALSLDEERSLEDLMTMYRVITGACRQGTQAFVDGLGDRRKERYTIREALALTRGQYGGERFAEFFGENG